MSKPILVFDMDGVLADVTGSYRETIARTAEAFIGKPVAPALIQEYKNQGGFNDDWKLTHQLIGDAGVEIPFERVRESFQRLFLGETGIGSDGSVSPEALILRERWVARPGVLERLAERFRLALFTGRPRQEAELTLRRFAPAVRFDPVICMGEVENPKPAPDGLLRILQANSDCPVYYVGDTVDDAQCARAARVSFIGVAGPDNPAYLDLVFLFQGEGAYAIVDDINYLEEVFAS